MLPLSKALNKSKTRFNQVINKNFIYISYLQLCPEVELAGGVISQQNYVR